MTSLPSYLQPLSHGVHAIDTGFQREGFDAAYLIVEQGRAAFVDTGTAFSVPRLLGALDALGLAPADVDWLIVTHVHLDHAGGAGLLLQSLPQARLVVHPRGARHMADPTALYAGAAAVYGAEETARAYGQPTPVPPERIDAPADGELRLLAGRPLRFLDTPGHARHHHCIWDAASRGVFTGDTFGISYREFDTPAGPFLFPTTTPVQFEPEAMKASVGRLMALDPQWAYLTHFSRVGGLPRLADDLRRRVDGFVALARAAPAGAARHQALKDALGGYLRAELRGAGWRGGDAQAAALLALDIELNAQGIGVWLDRETETAAKAGAKPGTTSASSPRAQTR